MLRPVPSSIHATANTPAEPVGARVARFPTAGSLPRFHGGSASALSFSRPARRLLALWPVWSLSRPRRPFVIGVLQTMLLPPSSAPTATGWSDSFRAGFAPAEDWRLLTAHVKMYAKGSCSRPGRLQVLADKSNRLSNSLGQADLKTTPAVRGGNLGTKWRWRVWRGHHISPSI